MYDVGIIGGGLSGLSAGIAAVERGCSVVVLEKYGWPRHKVCGEYLSGEVQPIFDRWGLDIGNPRVTELMLSNHRGSFVETQLPLPGYGVSRYVLDNQLKMLAEKKGVGLINEFTVNDCQHKGGGYCVISKEGKEIFCRRLINASGKGTTVRGGVELENKGPKYLGFKRYFRGDLSKRTVFLHQFQGGYGGAMNVGEDRVDIAYMIRQKELKTHGGVDQLERNWMGAHPDLKTLQPYEGEDERYSVSNFTLGKRTKGGMEGVVHCGDAGGMIPPATGNGMAMAIISGYIGGKVVATAHQNQLGNERMIELYQKEYQTYLRPKFRMGRMIQGMMEQPHISRIGIGILGWQPVILRVLIRSTLAQSIHELIEDDQF